MPNIDAEAAGILIENGCGASTAYVGSSCLKRRAMSQCAMPTCVADAGKVSRVLATVAMTISTLLIEGSFLLLVGVGLDNPPADPKALRALIGSAVAGG
jgi:hypothetical protein